MCGRYTLRVTRDELADRFDAPVRADFEPTYNAAPGQHLPVVRSDGDAAEEGEADEDVYEGDRAIDLLRWGFIPSWADDADSHKNINARAETVAEKPSFSDAYERRRCLVPADGFYEWTDEGPWYVDFDGIVALAGIWERHVPETRQAGLSNYADTDDGETRHETETFAVLTTEPSQQVARLHHRMAAVLTPDDEDDWLDGTVGAEELGPRELDADVRRVSERVNDPSNDDDSLVEEV